ncbi:hypothetical protein PGT21_008826 [Puccinia graminis f. sp. tritici]|uniref:Methyltransferase type 11 domain-containing protein n=2 Tax=Puccinia graminis f. sp. tritici TaxID=56615 RepID=E3K9C6_PUCGT|nr:uncharacterized protein PGTG_07313 [Puccinia graminis f. sp. tritici CRL 75-36-700-3]EFP81061.1 hypothetical protein PGTG_07313 [Puccinia graminis f. sp. tritici CRL 75-36-700-3]KAA1069004.1 hypothetical protein PGT21_008826 [Puccinia graminis f. sp. tritici]
MSNLPADNELYGTLDYWNSRYAEEQEESRFEWFKSYKDLSNLIERYVAPSAQICMLGCGNSSLSKDMYDSGFHRIANVDFSQVLIDRMRSQHSEKCPEMTWIQADVRHLPFPDSSFDAAIDKGTMDALMCAKGDVWDPPKEVVENCKMEVDEVARILKPGGVFIYITFGQPHFRKTHLQRPGIWSVEVIELGDMFHYYFYVMKKYMDPHT